MSKSFLDLGVQSEIVKSLITLNISIPTEIQEKVIPTVLKSSADVVAVSKTGTGKTAAFGLPLLQLIDTKNPDIQAVILAPTRELGQQITSNLEDFAKYIPNISIATICGGIPIKPQIERLKKDTHIVVATPGRFADLVAREAINIKNIAYLILDEVDEMVSALKEGLDLIIKEIPKKRRTFLFTATLSGAIRQLVNNYMAKEVVSIAVAMESVGHKGIKHSYVVVEPIEKLEVLLHFLNSKTGKRGIIFCKTKAAVNKLAKKLAMHKFSSGAIHGSLTQGIRDRILTQFREGHIAILIATDLAARGIDVKETEYVVNYHLPDTFEAYVHRTGRTSRAGATGFALSIIQEEEVEEIPDFENALDIRFEAIKKADAKSIEENNALVWANKIFKTKPNRQISESFKSQIKTIFHHLTKEELVDKILADYIASSKSTTTDLEATKKKKRKN